MKKAAKKSAKKAVVKKTVVEKSAQNKDVLVAFRQEQGYFSVRETADKLKYSYIKFLKLIGDKKIPKPNHGMYGSTQLFFDQKDIEKIEKILVDHPIRERRTVNFKFMADKLGMNLAFFKRAVATNKKLLPANGKTYEEGEEKRIAKELFFVSKK